MGLAAPGRPPWTARAPSGIRQATVDGAFRHHLGVIPKPLIVALTALAVGAAAQVAMARPMGHVFNWSHELNQEELPNWNPKRPPIPAAKWYRTVNTILHTAGANGMWFSGFGALPFDIPVAPTEPDAWRNNANFMRQFRATGLSWDANVEARAAKEALCIFPRVPKRCRPTGVVFQPKTNAPTRRMSLLDPAYQRSALKEIRRIVPGLAGKPYVWAFTGSDEPQVVLPTGRATQSAVWRRQRAQIKADFGWAPPSATAKKTDSPIAGLQWLAYSRWTSREFGAMKTQQADLIHRLAPGSRVVPNDYGMISGFMPWDYTQVARSADVVEADPYVSYAEKENPGRGRYNPGFGAKFMSDLTGKETRVIVQAFRYSGYMPVAADLDAWSGQALRAGATHISIFASGNPRFRNTPLYDGMLSLASRLKGADLPDPPVDPATQVVYSVMSEGQGRPGMAGDSRYKTSGDAIYTTYSLLGELNHARFQFDSDTRLEADPSRLAQAKVVWLPRGEVLTRQFAEALRAWVQAGGFLVITDPKAFARTPTNDDLSEVGSALMGGRLSRTEGGTVLLVRKDALATGSPPDLFTLPVDDRRSWAFEDVFGGATVVATHLDGRPAGVLRDVGQGRVLSFAADIMTPASLVEPMDLVAFVKQVATMSGSTFDDATWTWRVPGSADRPPWTDTPGK